MNDPKYAEDDLSFTVSGYSEDWRFSHRYKKNEGLNYQPFYYSQ